MHIWLGDPLAIMMAAWVALTLLLLALVIVAIVRKRPMKWTLRVLMVGWLILLLAWSNFYLRSYTAGHMREMSQAAPAFSFTTYDGQQVSLESLRGKTVLLDFWATWCTPCVKTRPAIEALHEKFPAESFEIIGISGDREEDKWRRFLAEHGARWPEYRDDSGKIWDTFGVRGAPEFVVISPTGVIRYHQVGWLPTTAMQLEYEISKTIKSAAR